MANARVLMLAIIVIVSTFTPVYTTNTEDVNDDETKRNIDKFVGLWYFVAELNIESSITIVECHTMNIVKIRDNHLKMSTRTMVDGEYHVYSWTAQVQHNKLYNLKVQDDNSNSQVDQLGIYENDNFLVLSSKTGAHVYVIYSRNPNISEESLREYKIIASIEQLYLHYGDNRNCRLRSIAQRRYDLGDIYSITGTWYMVLGICPQVLSYESACAHMNITKGPEDLIRIQTYKEHGSIKYMRNWNAKIFNSALYEMNSKYLNPPSYSIAYYNDKDELFLHNKVHSYSCDAVWSRNNFLSDESHKRYKQIAEKKGWLLRQVQNLIC